MKIFMIEAKCFNGDLTGPSTCFRTEEEARDYLKFFRCDSYEHINIKCVEAKDEDILFELLIKSSIQYHKPFKEVEIISVK